MVLPVVGFDITHANVQVEVQRWDLDLFTVIGLIKAPAPARARPAAATT